MRPVAKGVVLAVAIGAILFAVHHLAADDEGGDRIVIYPGDYVVQSGDVSAGGAWRDGVAPARVTIVPGDVVVQKADVSSMGRWRIDVNPSSGNSTATVVSDRIRNQNFEATKVEVSAHLNIDEIECIDCGSPTATSTRTIRVGGDFLPVPPATPAAVWSNPMIGWPSSPPTSGNVVMVSVPGVFNPPGPYTNTDGFEFFFVVDLNPVSTFSVYVDVLGDLTEP